MTNWELKTISEVAPELKERRLSPVELTEALLRRIATLEPHINAFITLRPEEAMDAARTAETEIQAGKYRGPLHGIPVAVKDNIATAGWPTTNGSKIAADDITYYDATVVSRLRAAGAIIIGKNNMHEWAMGGTSWGGYFGSVRNPWDLSCIPGGSSGGSAVAVSASLVFASVGTDGMGSIRIPASLCGVVGLKPTYGLVSRWGELPPTSSQMDHLGPLCKSVRDVALILNVLAGFDVLDPTSRRLIERDYVRGLDGGVSGLRIGVPQNYFFEEIDTEVQHAVGDALDLLSGLGASIRHISIPSVSYAYKAFALIPPETLSFHRPFLADRRQDYADREICHRLIALQFLLSRHTQLALQARNLIRRELLRVMHDVDVLVTPTVPIPAYKGESEIVSSGEGETTLKRPLGQHQLLTRLTVPFNFTGMPAISVPCGFTSTGLPIGLQIAGRREEDAVVLRVACAFEQSAGLGYQVSPVTRLNQQRIQ